MELFLALLCLIFGISNMLVASSLKINGEKLLSMVMVALAICFFAIAVFLIGLSVFAPDLIY